MASISRKWKNAVSGSFLFDHLAFGVALSLCVFDLFDSASKIISTCKYFFVWLRGEGWQTVSAICTIYASFSNLLTAKSANNFTWLHEKNHRI